MDQERTHLVVMAGGTGQRFWPWSRKKTPKQFQDFLGQGKSLLQSTIARFQSIINPANIWVVTQTSYKTLVKEQLPWLKDHQILDEPVAKNTAPCIAYACHTIAQYNKDASLVVTPADHMVEQEDLFRKVIQQALGSARQTNQLILLGAPCVRPETGYGYIAFEQQHDLLKRVVQFAEKPSSEQALYYMQQGNYAWNTGIFVGKLATFIASYQAYLPHVWKAFTTNPVASLDHLYQRLPAISFDQAILEKSKELYVIYQDFGWSDLGTWNALYEYLPKDKLGNAIQGQVVALNTDACLIKGDKGSLIAAYGVKDLVIVQQGNILLICPQAEVKNIKALVKDIEEKLGEEYL
jgi:mannose-1-phosphate guanylyltransferase